jgi:2-methylfumaryl-CoA hydratase
MSKIKIPLGPQAELAPTVPFTADQVRAPHYGRYLEDFVPGQVLRHPRGFTINPGLAKAFATSFHQMNPLYLNHEYARAHGFKTAPVSPQLVFNLVLSLGVQNDSEKAIANLGYYDAQFLRPVYPKDTIRAMTRVVDRKERGEGKPGIVHIQTLGLNQDDKVVLQYERKIMVAPRGERPETVPAVTGEIDFPWVEAPVAKVPVADQPYPADLTGARTYFEDFGAGDLILHANGRTVTSEHQWWTYWVGNTHPLHYDRVYSTGLSGAMSGEPIAYGGLIFAWLEGLASRDLSENAIWELGFTEGYHTQPTVTGDTVAALSRILAVEDGPEGLNAGVVTVQLIGVKNISAAEAIETYGEDLFVKETAKRELGKDKITAKIFEIERRLLIKKRPV